MRYVGLTHGPKNGIRHLIDTATFTTNLKRLSHEINIAYKTKSLLSVNVRLVYKCIGCLVNEQNKYKISTCFFENSYVLILKKRLFRQQHQNFLEAGAWKPESRNKLPEEGCWKDFHNYLTIHITFSLVFFHQKVWKPSVHILYNSKYWFDFQDVEKYSLSRDNIHVSRICWPFSPPPLLFPGRPIDR